METIKNVLELYYIFALKGFMAGTARESSFIALTKHNDYMYISYISSVNLILPDFGSEQNKKTLAKIQNISFSFQDIATDIFKDQIKQQCGEIENLLFNVSFILLDDSKAKVCTDLVSKACNHIVKVSEIWKQTLPTHVYAIAVGIFLNLIAKMLTERIEKLIDISDADSTRIVKSISVLIKLESLLEFNNLSLLETYTSSDYTKLKQIGNVLEWDLATIMTNFRGGLLKKISVTSLMKLVRALFAESDLRKKALLELKSQNAQ